MTRSLFTTHEIEALTQAYLEGQSVRNIAQQTGRSISAIQRHLHEKGVLRTRKNYNIARQHHVAPSSLLTDILTGLLLSDASISHKTGRSTALLSMEQHPSRLGWLEQLQVTLKQCGVTAKIDTHFREPSPIGERILPGGTYHTLRTLNYVEFEPERQRWYPTKEKIVPKDTRLTPVALTHWFCGDGRGGDIKGTLGFCTDGFTHEDVGFLVQRLSEDLGIEALKQNSYRGHPQILVGKQNEASKVKSIIEPHIPECCKYKLSHIRPRRLTGRGRTLPKTLIKMIGKERWTTTIKDCATRYGVSASKVWKIWHESQ